MSFKHLLKKVRQSVGFTMIELLIVIAILGILAVAVLSAINPIEQINRGRDTGTRSDAEQLLGALDRFNAFKGHFAWQLAETPPGGLDWTLVSKLTFLQTEEGATCPVLYRLSNNPGGLCDVGTDEVKGSFIDRIDLMGENKGLYIYKNGGTSASSTYVCFLPQSDAFKSEAQTRCGAAGAGLPTDLSDQVAVICNDGADEYYICLP
ncbi:MAG: prepilin-type N-terminal cleavage/methylation domain-containing protein [Patescibacteria group bacterium]|nr:prepilin-type N-terminal cleavage/methylation domain-containing protein [Patescibacteria group bacterium]